MNEVVASELGAERHLYTIVWVWLVLLLVVGLTIFMVPIPRSAAVILIFSIAAVKAVLVLRNYMHLKHEQLPIYLIAAVPTILFIGMCLTLIPDIVHRHGLGLGK